MKQTRFLLIAALVIVVLCTSLVFCPSTKVNADSDQAAYRSVATGVNSSIIPVGPGPINISNGYVAAGGPVLVDVSDEYAIGMVRKAFGNEVASHMIHRVTGPLVKQNSDIVFGTIKPTSKTTSSWGGYLTCSATPINAIWGNFNVGKKAGIGEYYATWVGIGGLVSETNLHGYLLQAGVDMNKSQAFLETFYTKSDGSVPPDAQPQYIPDFYVNPGDNMFVDIALDTAYTSEHWFVFVADETTNTYWSTEATGYYPNRDTAEWIVERPVNKYNYKIGKFGTISFFPICKWNNNAPLFHTINDAVATKLYKFTVKASDRSVTPSNLGSDGQSFTMTSN